MFEYHCPMCVKAIISSPVRRCRIGRSTPKTARSARLGFDPPAFTKHHLSGGNRRKKFFIPLLLKHGLIIIDIDSSAIIAMWFLKFCNQG
jgi:tRNA(Arg) A34 adenosine deaminase TadA